MASLRDLRKRISTVKNTRQITKAMKMVSASKLRRSQTALMSTRPYAYKLVSMMNSLKDGLESFEHPLLKTGEVSKVRLLIISSDRGLCGAYNSNIIKAAERYLKEAGLDSSNCTMDFIGKKAYDYFKKRYSNIGDNYRVEQNPKYEEVEYISERLIENYIEGEFDSLVVIYNEFKSAISQKITIERLFPIIPPDYQEKANSDLNIYEPDKGEILNYILPKYVGIEIFRMIIESLTSEYGARMTAMENATKNSDDIIKRITLLYNRTRQAAITTELSEIVGGKEALEIG